MMQGYRMQKKTKLPIKRLEQKPDTNLLQFMFLIARDDRMLTIFLQQIQFIREHPLLTEVEARKELERQALASLPPKPLQ
jgi:hypothetical protein